MVAHRSPKPRVAGSSPVTPARSLPADTVPDLHQDRSGTVPFGRPAKSGGSGKIRPYTAGFSKYVPKFSRPPPMGTPKPGQPQRCSSHLSATAFIWEDAVDQQNKIVLPNASGLPPWGRFRLSRRCSGLQRGRRASSRFRGAEPSQINRRRSPVLVMLDLPLSTPGVPAHAPTPVPRRSLRSRIRTVLLSSFASVTVVGGLLTGVLTTAIASSDTGVLPAALFTGLVVAGWTGLSSSKRRRAPASGWPAAMNRPSPLLQRQDLTAAKHPKRGSYLA